MISESALVDKVRVLMNEAGDDSGVSLISDDTLLLDKHIKALLPEAVLFVQMNKVQGTVNAKSTISVAMRVLPDGCAEIVLPDDYVRLVSLKLSTWSASCSFTCLPGSRLESLQKNRYTRAGDSSPVCVETCDESLKNVIKAYPVSDGGANVSLEYFIYEARYNSNEGISGGDDSLVSAVAYHCAALLCNVFGKFDAANVFMGFAAAMCGGK